MAVYLALLDENPADRKQAERLLYRESSHRSGMGEALYFDAFGSEDNFFPLMEKYDVALIDTLLKRDGMMVAADMMEKGCDYPVFLCSGELDYREKYAGDKRFDYENLHYLNKPLQDRDYRYIVDTALEYKNNKPRKVELRTTDKTFHVRPEEIISASETDNKVSVALTGNRLISLPCSIDMFIQTLGYDTPGFISISDKAVINMYEVASLSGNSFKMSNGAVMKFSFFSRHRILKAWKAHVKK